MYVLQRERERYTQIMCIYIYIYQHVLRYIRYRMIRTRRTAARDAGVLTPPTRR